ncbi:MAG: hypothetical protein AB8B56_07835 [Crocinitomicaceae bacterium]
MGTKKITKNYLLHFEGWAQGRMPTDPDPSYEPRGVSGYSFALPGEPDMDRIIYFQNKKGVVRRSFTPEVGVYVTGGTEFTTKGSKSEVSFIDKQKITKGHPLFNAKVDLKKNAVFVSENSTVIYNGFGVMNPFILSVEGKGKSFERRFYADPKHPKDKVEEYDIDTLTPYMLNTVFMDSVQLMSDGAILNRTAYRNERKKHLEAERREVEKQLKKESKNKDLQIKLAALNKRIAELDMNDPENRRTRQIGTQTLINYPLNAHEAKVDKKMIKPSEDWPITMWFGAWDADSLCFFVNGFIEISVEVEEPKLDPISTNPDSAIVKEMKAFAKNWNKLYKAEEFEQMKFLATEDVEIANATSKNPKPNEAGMIVGRDAYFDGIYYTYYGGSPDGKRLNQKNILTMNYEDWEYISVGNDEESYYTIGTYTINWSDKKKNPKPTVGVNCWLMKKVDGNWLIYRVINN